MCAMNLGNASIEPVTPRTAGAFETLTYTYTAGHCIDDGGFVKVVFQCVCDFAAPQFDRPADPNYTTIHTTGDCRIVPRWDPRGHVRPWTLALFLNVGFGHLDSGEKIRVVFGDRSQGSPGWRLQSFCQDAWEFKTLVDPIGTYQFKELPASPQLKIVPGVGVRAICIAPSQTEPNEPFDYYLKVEDAWGNPLAEPDILRHPGFAEPGLKTILAEHEPSGFKARSNPIRVVSRSSGPNHYWADFHGQSEETIGINAIDRFFGFARDYARLDICGHQGNDFQITDDFWQTVNRTTAEYHRPNRFVTFPGYEWSGNTPLGGDRNVYYSDEGGAITRSSCELLPGGRSVYKDSPTANDLFKNIDGPDPFVFAHVGGRYADIRQHDPDLEIAVEIHSCWGTFEWILADAFELGYRVGICANSDEHKCRPGASYPGAGEFGSYGGLTCVLCERLERPNIYQALKARHFYATTGNRALLRVSADTPDGATAMMGDVFATDGDSIALNLNWTGTGPLDSIEVRNGMKPIETFRPLDTAAPGRRIKVIWSGAEVRGRNRLATWDGEMLLEGNRMTAFTPINFWKPDTSLRRLTSRHLSWQSVTTGGPAGVILELEHPDRGHLTIKTAQGDMEVNIQDLGTDRRVLSLGGLEKMLAVYCLSDTPGPVNFDQRVVVTDLHAGDNPIYIHVRQEDGHMAWSSPIYVVRDGGK